MQFTEQQAKMFFELSESLQDQIGEPMCLILSTTSDSLISDNISDFDNEFNNRNAIFTGASYSLIKNMLEE